jgi:hypothetical protein
MSVIKLEVHNHERLVRLGLVKTTTSRQESLGFERYTDPVTGSIYLFSPRGYCYRRTKAGTYQVNPRFKVKGNYNGSKAVSATVRTNDPGALTEIAVRAVKNDRGF